MPEMMPEASYIHIITKVTNGMAMLHGGFHVGGLLNNWTMIPEGVEHISSDGQWVSKRMYPDLHRALKTRPNVVFNKSIEWGWLTFRLIVRRPFLRAKVQYGDRFGYFRVPDMRSFIVPDGSALPKDQFPGLWAAIDRFGFSG